MWGKILLTLAENSRVKKKVEGGGAEESVDGKYVPEKKNKLKQVKLSKHLTGMFLSQA